MCAHIILEHKQVVLSVVSSCPGQQGRVGNLVLSVMIAVAQGEDIVAQLQHHHREVNLGQLQIQTS